MPSTGDTESWHLGRRPALDGVRGVAIVFVLMGHSAMPVFLNAGAVGVNIFFTLSGFLITSLLLEECVRTGRVRFGAFYWRRALRLLPALVAMVAGVWILDRVLDLQWITSGASIAALFYATNFWIFRETSGALGHTWSLSLEEQFYLTWPLVMYVAFRIGRNRAVLVTSLVLGVASTIQLFRVNDIPLRGFAPDARSFFLLFGCALAAAMTGAVKVWAPSRAIGGVAAVLLVLAAMASGDIRGALAIYATILGSVLLVWVAATRGAWLLELLPLRWLGLRSYAIYLWHYPVVLLLHRHTTSWPLVLVLMTVISLVVAELSWWIIEKPFLRLKDRSSAAVRSREAVPADRTA